MGSKAVDVLSREAANSAQRLRALILGFGREALTGLDLGLLHCTPTFPGCAIFTLISLRFPPLSICVCLTGPQWLVSPSSRNIPLLCL